MLKRASANAIGGVIVRVLGLLRSLLGLIKAIDKATSRAMFFEISFSNWCCGTATPFCSFLLGLIRLDIGLWLWQGLKRDDFLRYHLAIGSVVVLAQPHPFVHFG